MLRLSLHLHLLLGNNLAGENGVVSPIVTDTTLFDQICDSAKQSRPDLHLLCAVTRAAAKKAILNSLNVDGGLCHKR